jgi:hypothetical protein
MQSFVLKKKKKKQQKKTGNLKMVDPGETFGKKIKLHKRNQDHINTKCECTFLDDATFTRVRPAGSFILK